MLCARIDGDGDRNEWIERNVYGEDENTRCSYKGDIYIFRCDQITISSNIQLRQLRHLGSPDEEQSIVGGIQEALRKPEHWLKNQMENNTFSSHISALAGSRAFAAIGISHEIMESWHKKLDLSLQDRRFTTTSSQP